MQFSGSQASAHLQILKLHTKPLTHSLTDVDPPHFTGFLGVWPWPVHGWGLCGHVNELCHSYDSVHVRTCIYPGKSA